MAVTFPAAPARAEAVPVAAGRSAVDYVRWALVLAASLTQVGIIWDIAWHRSIGRDTFWSPPHMVEYAAAIIVGLACGWLVLRTTFAGRDADRSAMVRFWGFRGPMGAWVCIWGTFAMLVSAPFDDWWHNAYGLDVKIVSPPHMVLAAGMAAIVIGAMLMTLAEQNRTAQAYTDTGAARWGFAFTAGLLLLAGSTASFEYTGFPNMWRSQTFYIVSAALFAFGLANVARTGKLRWPATAAAGLFMLFSLSMSWVLQNVPATPRLAPIENPVTHLVAAPFPILLIVPALVFDFIHRHWGERGDWRLAAILGPAFVLSFAAVSWPAAAFFLSPLARNPVLLADQWDYSARLGPWRYEYWDSIGSMSAGAGLGAIGMQLLVAALVGAAAARLGLALGAWMRGVRR